MVEDPPMAIVEEEIPVVRFKSPRLPSCIQSLTLKTRPPLLVGPPLGADAALDLDTCIIEEEIPQEEHHEEDFPSKGQPPLVTTPGT
jgi:hypothetical protein